jgi:hypothetical protein
VSKSPVVVDKIETELACRVDELDTDEIGGVCHFLTG